MKLEVPAIGKAAAILGYLAEQPDPVRLSDVVAGTGINKSSSLKLLRSLAAVGFVAEEPTTKRYRLGHALLALGLAVARNMDAVAVALPYLQRLVQEIELVGLVIVRTPDEHFLVTHKVESLREVKVTIALGERLPPNAPLLSRAYLAWQPTAVVDAFLARYGLARYTSETITDLERYRAELGRVRERGYAVTLGEYILRLNAIAAPVFGGDGQVAFLLATLGFSSDLTAEQFPTYGEKLRDVAAAVTRALGGRWPTTAGDGAAGRAPHASLAAAPRLRAPRWGEEPE